jgi:hypothetical protein
VEDLREILDRQQEGAKDGVSAAPLPPAEKADILCIGGRGALDTVAALLLTHVLETRGVATRLLPATAITMDSIGSLDLTGCRAVCLSYLSPRPRTYARFVIRRLRARAPGLKIVLGAWNPAVEEESAIDLAAETGADAVAGRLGAAADLLEQVAGASPAVAVPASSPH